MTAIAPSAPLHETLHQSAWRQTLALARRSLIGRLRQPAVLAPAFVFPLFFAALSASTYSRVKDAPGFPKVDSFLQFGLAAAILQGVLFGAVSGASDLAIDIEQGFWERLIASPVHRASIVIGRLASSTVVGFFQAGVFMALLAVFGVRVRGGPVAIGAIMISAALIALAVSSLLATAAIRTGSSEVVQGSFPLVFVFIFLSSAFMPRQLMHGWFRHAVDLNPVSHLIEGIRDFVLRKPLTASEFLRAWGIPAIGAVLAIALCLGALRKRLRQS